MSNKKTLAVTTFALLLSQQSFASDTEGFYFGGRYQGQFFNSIGSLEVKQTPEAEKTGKAKNFTINETYIGDKIKGQKPSEYKGDYNPPFAANIAFGYIGELGNNNYRAELEGMYSSIKADNVGLEGNHMSVSYIKQINSNNYMYTAKVDNNQIENVSVIANAYYHLKNDNFSFSPYVGAGVGLTKIEVFGKSSIRPAYQLKAGLDYRISEDINMHVGYRHFGAFIDTLKFTAEELGQIKAEGEKQVLDKTQHSNTLSGGKKVTEDINVGSGLFATHGIEAGLTFHFASQA